MRIIALLLALFFSALPALAELKLTIPNGVWQSGGVVNGIGQSGLVTSPPGKPGQVYVSRGSQPGYFLDLGKCHMSGTGGGTAGTVTSFAANPLSPLFTVSVSNATSTPTLSFVLSAAAAHTFLGTGAGTTPGYVAITLPDLPSTVVANVGNLSPLFTTTDIAQTLTFSLINANSGTLFGNFGGGSGAPSFNAPGTNDQILGVVHSSTGLEYKTLSGINGISIVKAPNSLAVDGQGVPSLPPYGSTHITNFGTPFYHSDVAISPDSQFLYFGGASPNSGDNVGLLTTNGYMLKMNLATGQIVTQSAAFTTTAFMHVFVSPDGTKVYGISTNINVPGAGTVISITTFNASDMSTVNTQVVAGAATDLNLLAGWAISDDGTKIAFVDNNGNGTVYLMNTGTYAVTSFALTLTAHNGGAICFPKGDNAHVFVSDGATGNHIHEYTTGGASTATFDPGVAGAFISFMRAEPNTGELFCSNQLTNTSIIIYDTAAPALVKNVPTGAYPFEIAFDNWSNDGVAGSNPPYVGYANCGGYIYQVDDAGDIWSMQSSSYNNIIGGLNATGLVVDNARNHTLYMLREDASTISPTDGDASANLVIEATPTVPYVPFPSTLNNAPVSDGKGDWVSSPIVNSNIAGDGIKVSSATGNVTITRNKYESPDQTITAAGALTVGPHLLGYVPKRVTASLVCQTGEANYTAGDVVFYGQQPVGTNSGYSCTVDATNLNIRFGSDAQTFWLPDKTTGVSTNLTNAKWKIRFLAD